MEQNAQLGAVFNIQRFSLNDGPGIRTVVFLKGCPLHCPWCSNPESQRTEPEVFYQADRCMHCGYCARICPQGAIQVENGVHTIDRSRCDGCGLCAQECACNALRRMGENQSLDKVFDQICKDLACYRQSGGGVTLSGGEPLVQHAFSAALLRRCRENGIHTAMETTGYASRQALEEAAPFVDVFLFDIKHLDTDKHHAVLGVENGPILENLQWLLDHHANVVARIPLIPGFNTDTDHLARLKVFLQASRIREVHLLPYHIYGEGKYAFLDRDYAMDVPPMDDAAAQAILEQLQDPNYTIKLHG